METLKLSSFLLILFTSKYAFSEAVDVNKIPQLIESHPAYKSYLIDQDLSLIDISIAKASGRLPSVSANARITRFDQNREFVTPVGNFGGVGLEQRSFGVSVYQPLFTPGKFRGEVEALKLSKVEKELKTEIFKELLIFQASSAAINQSVLKELIESKKSYISKLKRQKKEILRLLSLGKVSNIDELKINIALNQQKTELFTLNQNYEVSKASLGYSLGRKAEQTVDKIDQTEWSAELVTGMSHEVGNVQTNNLSLRALDIKQRVLEKKSYQIKMSYLPSLGFFANYMWDDPTPFNSNDLVTFGLQLKWNLFDANSRKFGKIKIASNLNKVEHLKVNYKNKLYLLRKRLDAEIQSLQNEKKQIFDDYKKTESVALKEAWKYKNGKSTLNELLEAELILNGLDSQKRTIGLRILAKLCELRYRFFSVD